MIVLLIVTQKNIHSKQINMRIIKLHSNAITIAVQLNYETVKKVVGCYSVHWRCCSTSTNTIKTLITTLYYSPNMCVWRLLAIEMILNPSSSLAGKTPTRPISFLPRRPIISVHRLSQLSMRNVSPGMKTATRRRRTLSVHEGIQPQEDTGPPPLQGQTFSQTFFTPKTPTLHISPRPVMTQRRRTRLCYLRTCPIGAQGPRLLKRIHPTGGEAVVNMGDILLGRVSTVLSFYSFFVLLLS